MGKNNGMLLMILLLVLVIVAASIFILRGTPAADDPSAAKPSLTPAPPRETEPAASLPSAQPGDAEGPGETDPGETDAPDGTPVPAETPEPTPAPTPKPTPAPAPITGSFTSDTETGLNLRVDWKTYTAAGGTRKLQVDVSIISYSIFASEQVKSITLRVGDKAWGADFAGVEYDGDAQISTPAASFTVDAPASGSTITVEWFYGGRYSGKELNTITARGKIQ